MSRIPKRYIGKTIDNFEGNEESVKNALISITSGESVFLCGKCGTGKTHLAIALLKKWLKEKTIEVVLEFESFYKFESPIFLPSVELFLELKATFNGNADEKDVIDKYTKTPLLIIDDVGSEKISDWSRQIFYLIIDNRYRNMKPTIITSNLSLQEISEKIDERISSRICEMGIAAELNGKDRRLK